MKLSDAQARCILRHHVQMGDKTSESAPLRDIGSRWPTIRSLENLGLVTISIAYSGYESTLTEKGREVRAGLLPARVIKVSPDDRSMLSFLRSSLTAGTAEQVWALDMLRRMDEAERDG